MAAESSPSEDLEYKKSVESDSPARDGAVGDPEKQEPVPPYDRHRKQSKYDSGDPFGDETDAEIKYKTMTWWQAAAVMIAETISLGILSLPSVLATVGMVGGIILILGLGIIATYTGYVLGQWKFAYPHVHNLADCGEILCGPLGFPRVGREIFGAAQIIFLIFTMGSHILTFIIAFDTITGHATCAIVWGIVGMIILFICTLPRTLKKVSYMSIVSFVSIISACLITMIGIGIEQPDPRVQAATSVSFPKAFLSVTNIVFAYAGHVSFFSFISELKNPYDFPKALYVLQISDTVMYIIVAIVVYRYGGPDVKSPALSSTSNVVMKVAYGIALPTIILAGIIYAHVAAKYIYVRLFRGTDMMSKRSWKSFGSWVAITLTLWVIAWIIAESIPVFNDLLALISALFASWFTYGLSGIFWLFLNKGQWFASPRKIALTCVNFGIFLIGLTVCGVGLYASGYAINQDAGKGGSWSCQASST